MKIVNIHEAKTHLSRLLDAVADGEGFIIAKAGRPLAKVVPWAASDKDTPQRLGFLAGQVIVPADFNAMPGHPFEEKSG
ncbi:MAG TPA: type II toxin-antitoxin system prevent-host-death family antitoxin [Rhizomicrobium sp.]|nr:type II toxin-antitoxin system prevent-host-death family antitoxin [Rhizomicrobium sp.]